MSNKRFNIDVRIKTEVISIDSTSKTLIAYNQIQLSQVNIM